MIAVLKASQKVRALDLSDEKRITLAVELIEKDGIFVLFAAAVKKKTYCKCTLMPPHILGVVFSQ